MAINIPSLSTTPKAFLDILKLEGAQTALPQSKNLTIASVVLFAICETLVHALDHGEVSAVIFGVVGAALLAASVYGVLPFYNSTDKALQTLTAAAGVGILLALITIVLHFVFSVALPPPLPTDKLVRFLLFPISIWNVFMLAFLFKHAKLRTVPAFALAASYVIILKFILATLIK